MTTTETTTCDGCRRPIEDERYRTITIQGPFTYADDPDDKHLCGPCWDRALAGDRNHSEVVAARDLTFRDTCQCGPCRDLRMQSTGDTHE